MKAKNKKNLVGFIKIAAIGALCVGCAFFEFYYFFAYLSSSGSWGWLMVKTVTPQMEQLVTGYLTDSGLPEEAEINKVVFQPGDDENPSVNIYIEIPNDEQTIANLMQILSIPPENGEVNARDYYGKINPRSFHNEIVESNKDTVVVEAYRELKSDKIVDLGAKIGYEDYTYPPTLPFYPIYLAAGLTAAASVWIVLLPIKKKKAVS